MADKKVVMVIANQGYQDFEYERPKAILEAAGYEVITAAKEEGEAEGKLGGSTEVDVTLNDLDILDYAAAVFVGGPGAQELIEDVDAHLVARDAEDEGIIIGAICIAPLILAHAGILKEKKVTCWNEDGKPAKRLKEMGATYVDKEVVIDGNFITANGPDAAEDFGAALVEALEEE